LIEAVPGARRIAAIAGFPRHPDISPAGAAARGVVARRAGSYSCM